MLFHSRDRERECVCEVLKNILDKFLGHTENMFDLGLVTGIFKSIGLTNVSCWGFFKMMIELWVQLTNTQNL